MKKLLPLLVSFILIFSLTGCSGRLPSPNLSFLRPATTSPAPLPTVRVTFPEGWNVIETAQKLEASGVCSAEEFIALTTDSDYLDTLNYTVLEGIAENESIAFKLEGFVFPDTYEFYEGESAEKALNRFLKNTESRFTAEMKQRADELGMSITDVLTLASIIQEEASDPAEMPMVSSVFHNRLNSSAYPRLQSDVTRNYVRLTLNGSTYLADSTTDYSLLYDTYECTDLPAGPICNPGINAINAALYPEESEYYFFFTDAEGKYYYNTDYETHQYQYDTLVRYK